MSVIPHIFQLIKNVITHGTHEEWIIKHEYRNKCMHTPIPFYLIKYLNSNYNDINVYLYTSLNKTYNTGNIYLFT